MITKLKTTIWALALLFSVASIMVISSCSSEEDDPVLPPTLSYQPTTVEVGSEATITPAVQGDAATYEITDADGTGSFVSINAGNGVLSVSASSTEGVYDVAVKATNAGGSGSAVAKITISEPVMPPGLSYDAATVAVGAEGTVTPAVTGDAATYEITDNGGAEFVSVNETTGVLSVAKESTTGAYTVSVKATNTGGTVTSTAALTIGINETFDPTGKGYTWQYYMNQDDPWTLEGLRGEIAELPFDSVDIPTGWPADWPAGNPDWNEQYLFPYLALGEIANLLMQLPGDLACKAIDEEGNTLYFEVEDDLTLTTVCTLDDAPGQSAPIGNSTISWAEGKFSWALNLESQIPITYIVDSPTWVENFIDPLEQPSELEPPPRIYPALNGMVEKFTIPTDVESEATILISLTEKKVEVVFEVHEL